MAKVNMPLKDNETTPSLKMGKNNSVVVSGCQRLNVREEPDTISKIVYTIPVGTVLVVDKVIESWFKIHTISPIEKIEGYVMRVFTKEI
jgi:hypothetical protein